MYIKQILISGFRNFKNAIIPFHEGVNVIIGHNNTGKSNLLRALAIVLGQIDARKLNVSDLFYETDSSVLKKQSPRIKIEITLCRNENEEINTSETAVFFECFTDLQLFNEAVLRYEFKLAPEQEEQNYINDVSKATSHKEIWNIIERDYIRFYKAIRSGGAKEQSEVKVSDVLDKIDLQFLDAIRDVSRELYAGYNPLLKTVLNYFIDYQFNVGDNNDKVNELRNTFSKTSKDLIENLKARLEDGKNLFLKYAIDAGATFNGAKPDFDGELTENDMFAALRMIIKHDNGVEIPATYNGLGYNNLIYMSLLIAKMQSDSSHAYMRNSAMVMSFLAIDECEAHLHPAMQYKFLKFLQENHANGQVNQIFITTHSPQLVSAVNIDDLICVTSTKLGEVNVGYPRTIYNTNIKADFDSKQYVTRFLDATKADMFFAKKLIFVEGLAEQLLIPVFAKYLNIDLTDKHVLVVNMGGTYYHHFLKMFDTLNPFTINKKIACLIDIDPCKKEKGSNSKFKACYPYEVNLNNSSTSSYTEFEFTHHGDNELIYYEKHPNIRYFRQDKKYGKTLEYEIMRENPNCKLLITESLSNSNLLSKMIVEDDWRNIISLLDNKKGREFEIIKSAIQASDWSDQEKRAALIASVYLKSLENSKGNIALELSVALMANLEKPNGDRVIFHVPKYIEEALNWLKE